MLAGSTSPPRTGALEKRLFQVIDVITPFLLQFLIERVVLITPRSDPASGWVLSGFATVESVGGAFFRGGAEAEVVDAAGGSRVVFLGGWEESFLFLCGFGFLSGFGGPVIWNGDAVSGVCWATERFAAASWSVDGDLAESEDECTHEFGAAGGADSFVCPVGFVSDFDLELELVHVADAGGFENDVWLEVAGVIWGANEGFHFGAEKLNVFESGVERDEHLELFFHGLGAGDIFNP